MEHFIYLQLVKSEKLRHCERIAEVFREHHWINSSREDGSVADLEELLDIPSGIWSVLLFEQQMMVTIPPLLLILLQSLISKLEACEEMEKVFESLMVNVS